MTSKILFTVAAVVAIVAIASIAIFMSGNEESSEEPDTYTPPNDDVLGLMVYNLDREYYQNQGMTFISSEASLTDFDEEDGTGYITACVTAGDADGRCRYIIDITALLKPNSGKDPNNPYSYEISYLTKVVEIENIERVPGYVSLADLFDGVTDGYIGRYSETGVSDFVIVIYNIDGDVWYLRDVPATFVDGEVYTLEVDSSNPYADGLTVRTVWLSHLINNEDIFLNIHDLACAGIEF